MIPILVAIVLALVLAVVMVGLFTRPRGVSSTAQSVPDAVVRPPCPLCGSTLAAGERVHSVVYATKTEDKLMEISGCPHCRPPATLHRQCPVCKKALQPNDIVTARVFERKNETGARKTHVHVLGCPRCRLPH